MTGANNLSERTTQCLKRFKPNGKCGVRHLPTMSGWKARAFRFIAVITSRICERCSWAGGTRASAIPLYPARRPGGHHRSAGHGNSAGKTLPPLKFALDEIVYVVEGRGLTTIWAGEKRPKKPLSGKSTACFWCRIITHISSVTCRVTSRCGCCSTVTCR